MFCPQCGTQQTPARFCIGCGSALPDLSTAAGAQLAASASPPSFRDPLSPARPSGKPNRTLVQGLVSALCIALLLIFGYQGFQVLWNGARNVSAPVLKPALPVVVSYRPSLVGQGLVAIFSNQSGNRLTLTVTFEDRTGQQRKTGTIDLDPNGRTEIGWLEGWRFEPGETIKISHPNYRPMNLRVP